MLRRVAMFLVAAALLACSSGSKAPTSSNSGAKESNSTDFPPENIDWKPCRAGLQCGTVTVPKDYDNPSAGTIALAIARRPAAKPDERKGVVLFNPGGPGAPVLDYIESEKLPPEVHDRYDFVGFD